MIDLDTKNNRKCIFPFVKSNQRIQLRVIYFNYFEGDHEKVGTLGGSRSLGRSVRSGSRPPHWHRLFLSHQRRCLHLSGRPGRRHGHQSLQLRDGFHEKGK